jgi:predicted acetyltransferase
VYLGAGVAGLYGVATLPGARGRGAGTAVTLAGLRAAHDRGYKIGILHSTPLAVGLYERIGFKPFGQLSLYAPAHLVREHQMDA